ncbi:MAG: hypothetical protein GXP42_15075 [Chloroflexi bacterium]|nr:hypothetical protein [Chloroflexota bacterium]
MLTTLKFNVKIPPQRDIHIRVPEDVPTGPAEVFVVITTTESKETERAAGTGQDLLESPLFGIWADRDDIEDSIAYARQLRSSAES